MSNFINCVLAVLATSLLSACGGGSSAPTTVISTNSFAVDTAFRNNESASRTHSIKVTATVGVQTATGTGTIVESALSPTLFNGSSAQLRTSTVNATLALGNQTAPFTVNGTTYLDINLYPVGALATSSTGLSSTTYEVSTLLAALPSAAKVGDSGSFLKVDSFSNAAKTVKISSSTITWALSADTASTALLKFTRITTGSTNDGTTIEISRITPAGVITPVQVDAALATGRVIFDFL
jgi:hypothetical protein